MSDWSHLKDEEESDKIREVREIAQSQFISLSAEHDRVIRERDHYKSLYEKTQECHCASGPPEEYEGPRADCAVHGAIRALSYWRARAERAEKGEPQ